MSELCVRKYDRLLTKLSKEWQINKKLFYEIL